MVFGTCLIRGGNTVWWGDLKTQPIKQGGGILSFFQTTVIGFKYFLGCQFMLCHGPIDELVDIQADVKSIPRTLTQVFNGDGSENFQRVDCSGDNLFGGTAPGGGGGISGTIAFYRGLDTQQPDPYLTAKQGRVVFDQSGIGFEFTGVGNGSMTDESGGSSAIDETITITAIGIDGNNTHSTFGKMKFSVVGSRSGTQHNSTNNTDGSNDCWADAAFSCPILNFTISTGSTQFVNGDKFTVVTEQSHVAPAYRRMCQAVFRQLYVGTSSYLKPLAFAVRRCPDPLGSGGSMSNLNDGVDLKISNANPALAIYEILTNVDWGLGIPTANMDDASFFRAGNTLVIEGLGISMIFDTQTSADQLIGEILRHCDGVLYTDPATGLWTIALARADYDPSTIPVLTVDSIVGTPDLSRGSWSETTNLVTIKFTSSANNWNDRVVRAYDAANIAVTGEVRSQAIDFKGITSAPAAALVAQRVLKTLSYPLAKIKLVANRSAWQFRPAGVFRFTWVPLGIVDQVFRITRIGYGELVDGKISIDAVEDIFGISDAAFVAPPASGWVNPLGAPAAPTAQELVECPYHFHQDGIRALALCACMDGTIKGYQVWLDEGSGYFEGEDVSGKAPSGKLAAAYPAATPALDSTGFTLTAADLAGAELLSSVSAPDVPNGKLLALIDDEIVSIQTVTQNDDGTVTYSGVMRGVADTVPVDHPAGTRVWFISEGAGLTKAAFYPADLTITAKLLPQNAFGGFALASASSITLTTRSRFSRPYPPGNLCMQSQSYGTRYAAITGGALALTWSSRNRLTQTAAGALVQQDVGDITPEASTTYDVLVFDANGVQIHSETALSPESWSYSMAQRVSDGPTNPDPITVQVFSNRGGSLESYMPNSLAVSMTGFGMDFGRYFGGITA